MIAFITDIVWEETAIENRFTLKSKVYFGSQSLQYLKQTVGSRAFIVTDSTMDKLGYLKLTADHLLEAGIDSIVFSDVRPDPDVSIVTDGLSRYLESGADVIVAIGGGSAIDTAKAILYFAEHLGDKSGTVTKRPLFIAIPSTSGTGSEVTNFSVITSADGKVCIVDETISPDIAILDSTCIQHVPQRVIADTGIDVLVHAVEAYVSENATDFTDALAEKAVRLIFEYLEALYKDAADPYARDRVQNASCMAGMAFSNANLGINHSLAHALGGTFHIPHGRANAMMLNAVMEYNAELSGRASCRAAERYARLAALLQLPARTGREGTVSFIDAVARLKRNLGIEDRIGLLKISQADFEAALDYMADAALQDRCTPTNPREPSREDLIGIYRKCY